MNDIYHRYKEKVSLTLIGPDIDTSLYKISVEKIPSMPINQYDEYMSNHHFDIGLAPLFDNELCRSKYFNKFFEYTKNNICGIYSDVMPYNLVVKNGVDGILVNNDPQEWYKAICYLIDNQNKQIQYIKNAQNKLINNFSLEAIAKRLNGDFPELFSYKAPNTHVHIWINMYFLFVLYELLRRFLLLLSKFFR